MTAVVGILNKHAVALAADSAVTIGGSNGRKILNKANKVFSLSNEHPIGIMIYNSASFMATPWETIINVYRKQLGATSFSTLREYQTNFIEFLRGKGFYTNAEMQMIYLKLFAFDIVESIVREIVDKNRGIIDNPSEANRKQFLRLLESHLDKLIENWKVERETCSELDGYTFEMFETYSHAVFEDIYQDRFEKNGINPSLEISNKIKLAVYYILIAKEDLSSYTGLVFCGFGEQEIYPQLISINISMVIDGRLRYFVNEDQCASISNENNGAICPFAQTDVINTILSGIDPSLDEIYLKNFKEIFHKYNEALIDIIGDSNNLLKRKIENLDTELLVKQFDKLNEEIKFQNYIIPLMSAVSSLSKEDLAEMAESLIYLTYLKRRMTFAEESVGGPVDVAIISKGDGFVWIKRKQYFKAELNQHLFKNI